MTRAAIKPHRFKPLEGSGAKALLLPPVLLLAIGLGIPIVAVIAKATSGLGAVGSITEPISTPAFRDGIVTTLMLAALTTAGAVLIGLVYALAMAVARPGLARTLTAILLITFWISLLVRTYAWLLALQPNGALDALSFQADGFGLFQTMPGLILPMIHILLPYMVLPIFAATQSIDPDQLRAARSLGAGATLVIRSVVLPALRPGILAGTVLVFILSLGFYVTPAFLGAPDDRVIAIVIGEVFGLQRNLPLAAAMGVLVLLATLVLYFVADRILKISEQWERF